MSEPSQPPSPALFFETAQAFRRTAALRAAVDLDLFSAIGGGASAPEAASKIGAPERSTRILCDYLTVIGFLTKQAGRYALTADSAMFLDKASPACVGDSLRFLLSPMMESAFADFAETVRRGRTPLDGKGLVSNENPAWVDFARGMAPLMMLAARLISQRIEFDLDRPARVLDIAAGHGMFGITIAQRNPNVEVTALDWPKVLEVARENAETSGVAGRYRTIAGDAFEVNFGSGYDVVLLTNILHHFDIPACTSLLRKVAAALKPAGRAVTLEFVPNEDRVSPPVAAEFSLTMLATTPSGDAYTFSQYEQMFSEAGFARSELHSLSPDPQQLVISYM